jgi:hypothetical protein
MFLDYLVHTEGQQMSHDVTCGIPMLVWVLPVPVAGAEDVVTPPYDACVLMALCEWATAGLDTAARAAEWLYVELRECSGSWNM